MGIEYFSHDYDASSDIKILNLIHKLGYEGYGIFWRIVEDLYRNNGKLIPDYKMFAAMWGGMKML